MSFHICLLITSLWDQDNLENGAIGMFILIKLIKVGWFKHYWLHHSLGWDSEVFKKD